MRCYRTVIDVCVSLVGWHLTEEQRRNSDKNRPEGPIPLSRISHAVNLILNPRLRVEKPVCNRLKYGVALWNEYFMKLARCSHKHVRDVMHSKQPKELLLSCPQCTYCNTSLTESVSASSKSWLPTDKLNRPACLRLHSGSCVLRWTLLLSC